jgi:DNA helicase-2/ATP-dependent DNA helicase PcrA
MISLSGLNPEQRLAAEIVDGPVLILAGAGSGKTRTITYRMAHMIDNLSISAKKILGVSFTNKAAKEMRERVETLLSKNKTRGLTLCTFHSLGVRILKKEISSLGYHHNFTIYDTTDQLSILREALKNYHADKEKFDQKIIQAKISKLKNFGIGPNDFIKSPYFNEESAYDVATEYCYHYYQDKLSFYNAIDFDDILFLTVELFKKFPEKAQAYSRQYEYIMIDEYQDTNTLQFQLVLALTTTHNNLCVVGDDDQAIYAFRGADVSNILNFEKHYPSAKVIKLERNYRSTTAILNLANAVIAKNPKRRDKTLKGNKAGPTPLLWAMAESDHEAEVVVEEILQYQSGGGHLSDVAILFRSKTQIPPFEDQLRLSQVPYNIVGGQKLYEKKEVKDLIAYLSFLHNHQDELSFRRILNVPARGIGTQTLNKYLEIKKSHGEQSRLSLYDVMKAQPDLDPKRAEPLNKFFSLIERARLAFAQNKLTEGIALLLQEIDFLTYIDEQYSQNAKQAARRKQDIFYFQESAERFERLFKQSATLENFLERILLQDSQDRQQDPLEDDDVRKNEVTVMSLHSAKGLEFDVVFFVGAEEDLLPHKKSVQEGSDINEELRLCYVGVTRAKEKLYLTYCKERKLYGKMVPRKKSRFLDDIGETLVEQDRTTFGHLTAEEAQDYKKNFFGNLIDSL